MKIFHIECHDNPDAADIRKALDVAGISTVYVNDVTDMDPGETPEAPHIRHFKFDPPLHHSNGIEVSSLDLVKEIGKDEYGQDVVLYYLVDDDGECPNDCEPFRSMPDETYIRDYITLGGDYKGCRIEPACAREGKRGQYFTGNTDPRAVDGWQTNFVRVVFPRHGDVSLFPNHKEAMKFIDKVIRSGFYIPPN